MQEHYPFVRDDILPSFWANAIQRLLSNYVAPNFRLTQQDATHVQVVAGANEDAAVIVIDGNWRWNEATVSRAHPGGAAATFDVFVTAKANAIVNAPAPFTDNTDYSFALAIVAAGATPPIVAGTVDLFRKIGELTWDGAAITSVTQLVGVTPADVTQAEFDAGIAGRQPLDSDLTAIAAVLTTAFGRGLLAVADAAALRVAAGSVIGTNVQAFDSDLAAIAALATTAVGRSLLAAADAAAIRTISGAQQQDADLDAIALLSTTAVGRSLLAAADATAIRTISGAQLQDSDLDAIALLATQAFGRSILTMADAATARTALGLTPSVEDIIAAVMGSGLPRTGPARLAKGTFAGAAVQTIYTVPAGKIAIITGVRANNQSGAAAPLFSYVNGAATTDRVGEGFNIPNGYPADLLMSHFNFTATGELKGRPLTLLAGDTLRADGTGATSGYSVFGYEINVASLPAGIALLRQKGSTAVAGVTTIYTVPVGKKAIVTSVRLTHNNAAAATLFSYLNGAAAADRIGFAGTIAQNHMCDAMLSQANAGQVPPNPPDPYILEAGDTLRVDAVTSTAWLVTGVELG